MLICPSPNIQIPVGGSNLGYFDAFSLLTKLPTPPKKINFVSVIFSLIFLTFFFFGLVSKKYFLSKASARYLLIFLIKRFYNLSFSDMRELKKRAKEDAKLA